MPVKIKKYFLFKKIFFYKYFFSGNFIRKNFFSIKKINFYY